MKISTTVVTEVVVTGFIVVKTWRSGRDGEPERPHLTGTSFNVRMCTFVQDPLVRTVVKDPVLGHTNFYFKFVLVLCYLLPTLCSVYKTNDFGKVNKRFGKVSEVFQ